MSFSMEPTMPHDNALTYANQPGNVGAWKLGEACRAAKAGGDPIDHGLSLLKELQARGYGVVDLAAHPGQPEPRAALLYEHDDGRYAVAPSAEEAHFTRDDPAWHRVGPVTVYGSNTAPHPEQRAEVTDDKTARLVKTMSDIIHDQTVAMQSAIIEWQHGNGAEAGLNWIVNTLEGPGHLPDFDAPHSKHAQFWFNANQANPLPTCFCGNPSSSLWMGQGFCCDEHYREAKAKDDAARAGDKS